MSSSFISRSKLENPFVFGMCLLARLRSASASLSTSSSDVVSASRWLFLLELPVSFVATDSLMFEVSCVCCLSFVVVSPPEEDNK